MDALEQKITNAVYEKLNDGTVEKLVGQYIEFGALWQRGKNKEFCYLL